MLWILGCAIARLGQGRGAIGKLGWGAWCGTGQAAAGAAWGRCNGGLGLPMGTGAGAAWGAAAMT